MPPRKPPRRTRERILETALALFNRMGEPHVTTAHIADEMGISPGNLYYHFANKDQIIGELYGELEASVKPLLAVPAVRAPGVEDLWLLLHLLFERMWSYRFFYRDLDEITSRNRRLASRFAVLTRGGEATVLQICRGMREAGTLHGTDREIAALAHNIAIVATYWMSFQRIVRAWKGSVKAGDEVAADLDFAAYQVLALIAPFLRSDERALIERLGMEYL
jgi:AcrR family transcriptional regulator